MLLLAGIGLAIGLVLGLTGAGGSVLAVPLLVLAGGLAPHEAGAVSLAAVAAAAATGAWSHWRVRQLPLRPTAVLLITGLPAAAYASHVAAAMPPRALTLAFCVLMLLVAARMAWQLRAAPADALVLRADVPPADATGARCPLTADGKFHLRAPCVLVLLFAGLVAGFTAGFFGVGAGFVIVPALTLLAGLSMQLAVAASLLVIALLGSGAFVAHVAAGMQLPMTALALTIGGALVGMQLARRLAPRLHPATLQRGFIVLILLTAGALAARTLPAY